MTPAGVITVKNWKRHQHYKYRTPPWIKLHADLLTTTWYRTLSDNAARWLIELLRAILRACSVGRVGVPSWRAGR